MNIKKERQLSGFVKKCTYYLYRPDVDSSFKYKNL